MVTAFSGSPMKSIENGLVCRIALAILLASSCVCARPTAEGSTRVVDTTDDKIREYLAKYGYLPNKNRSLDKLLATDAIKAFQKDVGHNSTGILSVNDLDLMFRRRCGNLYDWGKGRRQKRFVAYRQKWTRPTLTWKLEDPQKLLRPYETYVVRNAMHRAFNTWSSGSGGSLSYNEVASESSDKADITVFFANGEHNDTLPFDGKDGVVAHGFYPTDGNLHFDASEKWTLDMKDGVNLYQTAVHEIGHLMGLEHSADVDAIMYPINRPYQSDFRLGIDDVRGIRYIYSPWAWRHYFRKYLARLRRQRNSAFYEAKNVRRKK